MTSKKFSKDGYSIRLNGSGRYAIYKEGFISSKYMDTWDTLSLAIKDVDRLIEKDNYDKIKSDGAHWITEDEYLMEQL